MAEIKKMDMPDKNTQPVASSNAAKDTPSMPEGSPPAPTPAPTKVDDGIEPRMPSDIPNPSKVGERNSMNAKQVQRYMRLTELVPDLIRAVDEKKLSFTPAVKISFIKPKNQRMFAVSLEGQQSLSQAQKMRELEDDFMRAMIGHTMKAAETDRAHKKRDLQ